MRSSRGGSSLVFVTAINNDTGMREVVSSPPEPRFPARGSELKVIAARPNSGRPYTDQEFFDSPFYMPGPVIMWHYTHKTRSSDHLLIGLTRIQTHRFNPQVHKWYVLCQDEKGYHYSASYHATRAEARAARRKIRNNPFMREWKYVDVYQNI